MRTFDFSARSGRGQSRDTRAWSVIYAEGHARDEPNPLAAAIAYEGWTMLRSGRMSEGEAAFHEAIKLDPSFAGAPRRLASSTGTRGQLEEAARELRTAKALDFRLVHARVDLGFVLFLLGKHEEALEEFRRYCGWIRAWPAPLAVWA